MEQARASGRYGDAGGGEEGLSDQAKISISRSGSLTQQGGALIERVGLDVFVRDPAFLESYPAFLGERAELSEERGCEYRARSTRAGGAAYPTAVEDEFAVGLVFFDGLSGETCGLRVELEDLGCHGLGGGCSGWFRAERGRIAY